MASRLEIWRLLKSPHFPQKAIHVSLSHDDLSSPCSPRCADEGTKELADLMNRLGTVAEQRKRRGKIYSLAFVLTASLIAVLGGAKNFREVADQIADFPQELLRTLDGTWCHFRGRYRTPSEKTVRYVFSGIDASALDKAVGTWLQEHSRRDIGDVLCLAVDGKTLRGVTCDDDHQFTLFSAMVHQEGVTIAQVAVPPDTKENTQVKALLEQVTAREGERVVVTMDAAHTQRDTASYLAGTRGFDYVMNVKGNRPTLFNAVFIKASPLVKNKPDHTISERGHGRINQWETRITAANGINFPHARQVGCIRRDVYALDNQRISREYAWIITSIPAKNMDAARLHEHVRSHWGIENKSHYVRDTTWREDTQHVTTKNAAHAMATLRNTAISLLRLHQHHDIKRTTERICRNPSRALHLLIT